MEWSRPNTVPNPNVWSTFKENDLNSDELVEYRIQDLPESLFDKAIEHMVQNYIRDEPVSNTSGSIFIKKQKYTNMNKRYSFTKFADGVNDHVEDYVRMWRAFLAQKTIQMKLLA